MLNKLAKDESDPIIEILQELLEKSPTVFEEVRLAIEYGQERVNTSVERVADKAEREDPAFETAGILRNIWTISKVFGRLVPTMLGSNYHAKRVHAAFAEWIVQDPSMENQLLYKRLADYLDQTYAIPLPALDEIDLPRPN